MAMPAMLLQIRRRIPMNATEIVQSSWGDKGLLHMAIWAMYQRLSEQATTT